MRNNCLKKKRRIKEEDLQNQQQLLIEKDKDINIIKNLKKSKKQQIKSSCHNCWLKIALRNKKRKIIALIQMT